MIQQKGKMHLKTYLSLAFKHDQAFYYFKHYPRFMYCCMCEVCDSVCLCHTVHIIVNDKKHTCC